MHRTRHNYFTHHAFTHHAGPEGPRTEPGDVCTCGAPRRTGERDPGHHRSRHRADPGPRGGRGFRDETDAFTIEELETRQRDLELAAADIAEHVRRLRRRPIPT